MTQIMKISGCVFTSSVWQETFSFWRYDTFSLCNGQFLLPNEHSEPEKWLRDNCHFTSISVLDNKTNINHVTKHIVHKGGEIQLWKKASY